MKKEEEKAVNYKWRELNRRKRRGKYIEEGTEGKSKMIYKWI